LRIVRVSVNGIYSSIYRAPCQVAISQRVANPTRQLSLRQRCNRNGREGNKAMGRIRHIMELLKLIVFISFVPDRLDLYLIIKINVMNRYILENINL
jgi:hypothetical protein